MRTIHKYTVAPSIPMPAGARLLHVGEQNGWPTVWAMVDTDQPTVTRRLELMGTGWPLNSNVADQLYVGTIQMSDGLVWHVFDLGETA